MPWVSVPKIQCLGFCNYSPHLKGSHKHKTFDRYKRQKPQYIGRKVFNKYYNWGIKSKTMQLNHKNLFNTCH